MTCFILFKEFLQDIIEETKNESAKIVDEIKVQLFLLKNYDTINSKKKDASFSEKILRFINPQKYEKEQKELLNENISDLEKRLKHHRTLINIVNELSVSFSDTQAIRNTKHPLWLFHFIYMAIVNQHLTEIDAAHILGSVFAFRKKTGFNDNTALGKVISSLAKYYDIHGYFQICDEPQNFSEYLNKFVEIYQEFFKKTEGKKYNDTKISEIVTYIICMYNEYYEENKRITNIFYLKDNNGISYLERDLKLAKKEISKADFIKLPMQKIYYEEKPQYNFYSISFIDLNLIFLELKPGFYVALGAVSTYIDSFEVFFRLEQSENIEQIMHIEDDILNRKNLTEMTLARDKY